MNVNDYRDFGFDPIPLKPGSKLPVKNGWQKRDSDELWRGVPDGCNVGLRGGKGKAFLDCDQIQTFENAVTWLEGNGILEGSYPVIISASGVGRHIYLSLADDMPGNYRVLDSDFGAGEFRYGSGAYVVAPDSEVSGAVYTKIAGEFWRLPTVNLADVLPLLANKSLSDERGNYDQNKPRIPKRTLRLLRGLESGNFVTRSELEQSIILGLVNAGHSFDSILAIFTQYQPGKYAELYRKRPALAEGWLLRSFENAVKRGSHDSPTRQKISELIALAESSPWSGTTGLSDRAVYLAHLQIAHRTGAMTYGVSVRELAQSAGVCIYTASKSTARLTEAGLLKTENKGAGEYAAIYSLTEGTKTNNTSHIERGSVWFCPFLSHDVFRHRGLGKTAAEVFSALSVAPLKVSELSQRTGRHPKTIRRTLKKMSHIIDSVTGEVLSMVERDGDKWRSLDCDLDLLARVLGVAGIGERQKAKHREERRAYRRQLEAYRERQA